MPDDRKNSGPEDGWRISLTQLHEVRYWTKALGVDRATLSEIIGQVGNVARNVRAEIARRDQATVPPSGDNEGA